MCKKLDMVEKWFENNKTSRNYYDIMMNFAPIL